MFVAPPVAHKIRPTPTPTGLPRPTATVTTRRPFKDYHVIEYDFPSNYDDGQQQNLSPHNYEENQEHNGIKEEDEDPGIQYIVDYSDYVEGPPPSANLKKNLYRHILTPETDEYSPSPYVVDLTKKISSWKLAWTGFKAFLNMTVFLTFWISHICDELKKVFYC